MFIQRIAMIHRIAWKVCQGMDFPTQNALDDYLDQHPNADPSNHQVVDGEAKRKVEPKAEMFSSHDMALPTTASQPQTKPDALFKAAEEAHKQSLAWLNQGKGLDSVIGAHVVRIDQGDSPDVDYSKKGPIIVIGPPKSQSRSKEKVETDYDGDWSQLLDVVRASVALDSMDDVESTLDLLRKSGMKLARRPKNRFLHPTDVGYRDIMLNVEYPNGHIGELQIHLKPILQAKAAAHADYEVVRAIGANAKKEGRIDLTTKEQDDIQRSMDRMKKQYASAWEASTHRKTAMKTKTVRYYQMDGFPVKWDPTKLPLRHTKDGKLKPIYTLDSFLEQADPIDYKHYHELVNQMK